MNTVELEKIKFGCIQRISKQFLDAACEYQYDFIYDQVEMYMTGFLIGERLPDITVSYPKDWWEAFKDRWFPKWLRKRYPIILQNHTLSRSVVYPDLKVSLPKNNYKVVFGYTDSESLSRFKDEPYACHMGLSDSDIQEITKEDK